MKSRFCQAVWQLHSKIFHGYSLWLSHVGIKQPRTSNSASVLETSSWDAPEAVNGLISELSIYFLVRPPSI